MKRAIIRVKIDNEVDIVLAHKRARQLANLTGLNFADQAKFAAAVSEIARNTIEHAFGGEIIYFINELSGALFLFANVTDNGPGIPDVGHVMQLSPNRKGKGIGLRNSKKVVDHFFIKSEEGVGTCVEFGMKLPVNHPPINPIIIKGWIKHFENELPVSPYEELKKQNDELMEAFEQLKYKNLMVENQLEEIKRLNSELQTKYSEVASLSREKESRNKELEEKNKQLDEFAYIITHDLKAPLNNMTGLVEIFKDELENTEVSHQFDMFQEQVAKLHRMVESISHYTRSGKESIPKTWVRVPEMISDIVSFLPAKEGIKVEIQENIPELFTEEIYLQQIFNNLLSNALKYHDKKNGFIKVSYRDCENGTCEFTVYDNGPGIPNKDKDKIFDLFHTIHENRSIHSTGIGLSIVKKIIQSKGGKIWVEDNDPKGSKFIFTWPADLQEKVISYNE